ncbi:hypothetical protein BHE74_00013587 [Ensete ventricosum]|nr:hypothetical protein BHE74_00013587 [Ensete ventricosum]
MAGWAHTVVLSWICGRLSVTRIVPCASYEIPLHMGSRIGLVDPLSVSVSENESEIASDPYNVTSMANCYESAYGFSNLLHLQEPDNSVTLANYDK